MSQFFKIRKNKSLKQIKVIHNEKQAIPQIAIQSIQTQNCLKPSNKLVHLEPLKTKISYDHANQKISNLKLDFTQPVSMKSISFNRNDCRYQNMHLTPLQFQNNSKQNCLDQQNRPASMNELKLSNNVKLKSTFYKTQKYDSMKMFNIIVHNRKTETIATQGNLHQQSNKTSRSKIRKSQSRNRLLKISNKDQKQQANLRTQIESKPEEKTTFETRHQKIFRKGIIDQIFQRGKQIEPKYNTNTLQAKSMNSKSFEEIQVTQSKIEEEVIQSPFMKRVDYLFEANCSTIKEKEQNGSSFISRNALIDQFIEPTQNLTPIIQDKMQMQKKRKQQFDKIRKKFPQNFFK